MFTWFGSRFADKEAQPLLESSRPLLVHRLDGTPVDVDLTRVCSVAEVRERVAVALGVSTESSGDTQPHVGIKLLSSGCDICDETSLDSLDRDLGLSVVLVQGAPGWYPREKYMYDDQEVLQLTMTNNEYHAEFINGSSQQVDRALYQKALQEWGWQEVSLENRFWAHPPEKPKESGGWTDFMAGVMTRRNAVRGMGVATGFLAGVTGHADGVDQGGNGDFGTAFQAAQIAGLTVYGVVCIARLVGSLRK